MLGKSKLRKSMAQLASIQQWLGGKGRRGVLAAVLLHSDAHGRHALHVQLLWNQAALDQSRSRALRRLPLAASGVWLQWGCNLYSCVIAIIQVPAPSRCGGCKSKPEEHLGSASTAST